MEVGARDVQGLPHLAQPAPRQSYAPTAGKTHALQPWAPTPMESGTCQTDLSVEKKGRRDGGKRMIQRLNEENGHQENTVWRWCKQGWPRLSQMTDRWPRPWSLLLTVLNKYLFNFIKTNYTRHKFLIITQKNNYWQVFSRSSNNQPLLVKEYKFKVGWQSSSLKNRFSGLRRAKQKHPSRKSKIYSPELSIITLSSDGLNSLLTSLWFCCDMWQLSWTP